MAGLPHVTWDALHYGGREPIRVRPWYPPLCIRYDVALAASLHTRRLWLRASSADASSADVQGL